MYKLGFHRLWARHFLSSGAVVLLFVLISCRNSGEIAFPNKDVTPSFLLATDNEFHRITSTPSVTRPPTSKPLATETVLPPSDLIAFVVDSKQLYIIAMDSSDPEIVFDAQANLSEPQWREDSDELIFLSDMGNSYGKMDIYSINVRTRQLNRITNDSFPDLDVSISPSGNQLVYVSERPLGASIRHDLISIDFQKQLTRTLSLESNHNWRPSWSPNGRLIAFVVDNATGGFTDLYLYDVDTNEARYLLHDSVLRDKPIWSPNGDYLAISLEREGLPLAYTISIKDGGLKKLLSDDTVAYNYSWSPDGRIMLYETLDGIYTLNMLDQSAQKVFDIPSDSTFASEPKWSLDGQYIAFVAKTSIDTQGYQELYVMKRDGGDLKQLTRNLGCCSLGSLLWYSP